MKPGMTLRRLAVGALSWPAALAWPAARVTPSACLDRPPADPVTRPPPVASAPEAAPPPAAEASAPAPPFVPERVHGEGKAMGTHVAFAAYTTETVDAKKT